MKMSFFFDVWTYDGFVLASDVRLMVNDQPDYAHKIVAATYNSRVRCAIAVSGVSPEKCANLFFEAISKKDTMREVAQYFASKWTDHYAGTEEYSAVHLVGFEEVHTIGKHVPQMWYWHTWEDGGTGFLSEERLRKDLSTFTEPVPANNHIPRAVKELTGKFPGPTLEEEYSLVASFLHLYQPFFTWNGDTAFWRSAANTVGSAMNLLWRVKTAWTIDEAVKLTTHCLEFLIRVGNLLPESTIGFSPDEEFDVLVVTSNELKWISRSKLSRDA